MSIKAHISKLAVVFHPGKTLSDKLTEMGMSIKEFAVRTSKPEKTIIAAINGRSSITTEMAVSFENVTKIPASFWLRKQQSYDEYIERKNREAAAAASADWMKKFPVAEMVKRGWLPYASNIEEKVQNLFSFFAISTEKAWNDYYINQELKVAFRISLVHTKDPHAMSAWLRQGEIQANELRLNKSYNEKELRSTLPRIKKLMVDDIDDFYPQLQQLCANCGIKLISTVCLPKAPISGATRWINDTPIIQLSNRYKRYDIFWFNFFHEIGHILLHGKKDIFLEKAGYLDQDMVKEQEADKFAANQLLSPNEEQAIIDSGDFSVTALKAAASKYATHPSIIVGRLQHMKAIDYWQDQSLLKSVSLNSYSR